MRCWPAEPGAFRPQLAHRPQPSLCNPLPRDPVTLPLDVAQWRQKDSPRIPITFLSGTIILRGESEYNLFVRLFCDSDTSGSLEAWRGLRVVDGGELGKLRTALAFPRR